ncbi:pleiotropic drug resistance protein 3-like [Gossypium australe]|uniref:Pleiotropic drug resistance protein 3-like n=1 Tax=Gossypium australe TaxID=47621 RepID=A0A5B6WZM4_9ROSI|nr:pleiotropic drug resistance protein 3-like [Gossypium australe]
MFFFMYLKLIKICLVLNKGFMIFDPLGQELVSVAMNDRIFLLDWNLMTTNGYTSFVNESHLWHKILGHANYRSLSQLYKFGLVENLSKEVNQSDVCEACQFRKQSRLPFPTNKAWRAIGKLHLAHTDVCGPMKTSLLNGNNFFILFIDDSTRYCWVHFLKHKLKEAQVFWKYKAAVENQSCFKLRILRSDNGTEYTSKKYQRFCKEAGIEHQLVNNYIPQ